MSISVICRMADCKHRSKRKSRKWISSDGKPLYLCTLERINISPAFDPDGEIMRTVGKENTAICKMYEPITKKIYVTDILWDAPESVELPNEITIDVTPENEYLLEDLYEEADKVSDYITDMFGYCHSGFAVSHEYKEQLKNV